jgi:hypothetical protein
VAGTRTERRWRRRRWWACGSIGIAVAVGCSGAARRTRAFAPASCGVRHAAAADAPRVIVDGSGGGGGAGRGTHAGGARLTGVTRRLFFFLLFFFLFFFLLFFFLLFFFLLFFFLFFFLFFLFFLFFFLLLFLLLFVFFFSVFFYKTRRRFTKTDPGQTREENCLHEKEGILAFQTRFQVGKEAVNKTRLFLAAFYTENEHHFTKTGSGQTQGNALKKWSYCFLQVRVKSKLLRPEERLVKAGALARL